MHGWSLDRHVAGATAFVGEVSTTRAVARLPTDGICPRTVFASQQSASVKCMLVTAETPMPPIASLQPRKCPARTRPRIRCRGLNHVFPVSSRERVSDSGDTNAKHLCKVVGSASGRLQSPDLSHVIFS